MTDWDERGNSDSIAITLWDKNGGMWFSSSWTGTTTVEQELGGVNLQVPHIGRTPTQKYGGGKSFHEGWACGLTLFC